MTCFLGIDLGASSVKVLVVDEAGPVREIGSAECPTRYLRRRLAPRGAWVSKGARR